LRKAQVDVPCQPFLILPASLGSITDTLTLTGENDYVNDFKVRLRVFTDFPGWQKTSYGRDKLWLVGCLGSEPIRAQWQTASLSVAKVKPLRLG